MRSRVRVALCGAAALLALGCASERPPAPPPPRPAPVPAPRSEKTAADPALQRDIEKLISDCEQSLGAAGHVVDTRFEKLEGQTVVESWFVARVGGEVVYLVTLTPSEQGVQMWVQCPPAERVK